MSRLRKVLTVLFALPLVRRLLLSERGSMQPKQQEVVTADEQACGNLSALEEQRIAVETARGLLSTISALQPEDYMCRFHYGADVIRRVEETAVLVLEMNTLWSGIVLVDLRQTVGLLCQAMTMLEQGKRGTARGAAAQAAQCLAAVRSSAEFAARADALTSRRLEQRKERLAALARATRGTPVS